MYFLSNVPNQNISLKAAEKDSTANEQFANVSVFFLQKATRSFRIAFHASCIDSGKTGEDWPR